MPEPVLSDLEKLEALVNACGDPREGYSFDEWLHTTTQLQILAYGRDPADVEGDEMADFARWNMFAAIAEIVEMSEEIGWKPWATSRLVNREAMIGEAVDALHFLANLLRMVGCSGAELTRAYKAKQLKNLQRQIKGYDGVKEKCAYCHRELDRLPTGPYGCSAPDCVGQDKLYCSEDHHRNWVNAQ